MNRESVSYIITIRYVPNTEDIWFPALSEQVADQVQKYLMGSARGLFY